MYLRSLLASFPEVLTSRDLARALGCTARVATQLCHDRYLVAAKVAGEWSITRDEFLRQMDALRSPCIVPALRLVADEGLLHPEYR